ncbi:putative fumarate hydratase, class II [Burkholderia pseudomallei]|nr:putative fumarate hydratase, class II [Burkholderia pseudomallei]
MTPATPTKRPPPSHIEHARSQRRPDEKRSPRHVSMLAPAATAPLVALRMRAARSPISAPPRRPSHAARHEIARGAMLAHQWMPSRERLRPRMRIAPRPRGVPRHLKEQS